MKYKNSFVDKKIHSFYVLLKDQPIYDYILKSGQEMRVFYPFFLQFCFCVHFKVLIILSLEDK